MCFTKTAVRDPLRSSIELMHLIDNTSFNDGGNISELEPSKVCSLNLNSKRECLSKNQVDDVMDRRNTLRSLFKLCVSKYI